MTDYLNKYIKYKTKYFNLKAGLVNTQIGGLHDMADVMLFKAEWCGHCKQFKPTWDKLQSVFNKKFNFITYDSDKDTDMLKKYNIDGFPTIIIKNGSDLMPYEGGRDIETLTDYLNNMTI